MPLDEVAREFGNQGMLKVVLACELGKVLLKFGKQRILGPDRSVAIGGEIGKLSRASSLAPLGELATAPIATNVGWK